MSWNIDKVKEIISPLLDKKEQILSVGLFRSGPPWWLAVINPGDMPLKNLLYVCITSRQIFTIPTNVGDFEADKTERHKFENIELKGNDLFIRRYPDEKTERYRVIGTPKLAGVDMEKFRQCLQDVKRV